MSEIIHKKHCPRCMSEDIKVVIYLDVECIICNHCGYDERNSYDIYPDEKTNQKLKGRFSPYRVGGGNVKFKK